MMKMKRRTAASVSSLAVMAAVLLTGCGTGAQSAGAPAQGQPQGMASQAPVQTQAAASAAWGGAQEAAAQTSDEMDAGSLLLSVNPEIQIEYNREGRVTDLNGMNPDGEVIVSSYRDYIGKPCGQVLEELVAAINAAGYFVDDVDGGARNIVLQLEPGSLLPGKDFMEDMSTSTRNAVYEQQLASRVVLIEDDDYDPNYSREGRPSHYITLDKAKEIALADAQVNAADAVFVDREFDHDDGTPTFELEFTVNGKEYEYEVHAENGRILEGGYRPSNPGHAGGQGQPGQQSQPGGAAGYADTDYGPDNDGVTDYADTDYGPNNDGVTDYADTDYGPNNDGVTDYTDTDYGPNNDGVTDYADTDYGPNNDGVTDYHYTDYGDTNYGNDTNYDDYGDTDYDDGGDTDYDD